MENLHGLSGQFVDIHRPGSVVKNPPTMQEPQKTRGWSPGQKDPLDLGNPLQYSFWDNPVDRGAWWATVHGVTKSQTWLKQLSMHAQTYKTY